MKMQIITCSECGKNLARKYNWKVVKRGFRYNSDNKGIKFQLIDKYYCDICKNEIGIKSFYIFLKIKTHNILLSLKQNKNESNDDKHEINGIKYF